MARLTPLLLAAAALTLTACDQIRVPGNEETAPEIPSDTAATPVDTPDLATDTAPPVSDDPVTIPVTDTDPVTDPVDEPDAADISAVITDLAAINAAVCGLALQPVDNSLTFAERAGAQPADPDAVNTATISGTAASLASFPGLVKMEPREILPGGAISSGHCGATRIAENWFITAAHCLDDDYDEVVLVASSETLSSPLAKRVQARASLCHAAYGGAGDNYVNDIALLRVDDSVLVDLASVPIANFGATDKALVPFNYGEVSMAGWGLTSFNGSLSNELLSAELALTGTGPAAIGVESVEGSGPCIGDSGGPLFISEEDGTQTVIGVLSVVEQNLETRQFCEGRYGARYTNLQGYDDWIRGVMTACDSGTGLCGY